MLPAPVERPAAMYAHNPPVYLPRHDEGGDVNFDLPREEGEDVVGSSDNEETRCAENIRLLEDYPEPLTAEQRTLLHKHTAALVYQFKKIQNAARIIERGHKSLQSLLSRLENERTQLRASLDDLASQEQTPAPAIDKAELTPRGTAATEPSSGRRPRGLLQSAMFANMRSVLSAAKREEQQTRSNVTLEREKIGKMTRLKIIEEDLAKQGQYLAPLTEKYEKSSAVLQTIKEEVLNALRLYDEMQRMEVAYASRFFLRASGSQESDGATKAASYDIFFTPAKYTDEVQDMIREQVEELLEEYLAYRRRADPFLELLAEKRRHQEAKRTNQLLKLIGVDTNSMRVEAFNEMAFAPQLAVGTATTPAGSATSPAFLRNDGATTASAAVGQISDPEDDNDDEDNGGEQEEKKQRDQIQSALAALDDFEELY